MAHNVLTGRRAVLVAGLASLGVLGTAMPARAQKKDKKVQKLKDAIVAMKEAKGEIEKGGGFGGHKKKAVDALTTAIDELEVAIKFADEK